MAIHVEEIYTFDQDTKSIGVRHPSRLTLNSFTEDEPSTFRSVHVASGLSSNDFGFFVDVINNDWVDRESFLMTSYMKRGHGLIKPSDDVMARPDLHMTTELARKIAFADPDDIRQFGLGSLIDFVKKRYPNFK